MAAGAPAAEKRGLSARALKWIAMITMAIDHAATALAVPAYLSGRFARLPLMKIYQGMRLIGRLSLPLFLYLIVDSFFHTRNRRRFAAGLLVFALISELPFDAAITCSAGGWEGTPEELFACQNIYFTLLIGTLCLLLSEYAAHGPAALISEAEVQKRRRQKGQDVPERPLARSLWMTALITASGCALAYFLHVDYGIWGVLAMVSAYLIHQAGNQKLEIFGIVPVLAFGSALELAGLADAPLIFASSGRRGPIRHKWLYYIFYPAHLAVLAGIRWILFPY